MERAKSFMDELYTECKENNVSCLSVIGDEDNYAAVCTEDQDLLKETLYFAFSRNEDLLEVVEQSASLAREVLSLNIEKIMQEK